MAKKKVTHQPKDTKHEAHQSQSHNTHQATTMDEPSEKVQNNTHQATAKVEPSEKVQNNTHQATAKDEPSEKVQNLKSLNSLLLKETFDRRQQVESLMQAKEGLESELTRFRVESKLLESELTGKSEENVGLELEKSVFCVFVLAQMGQMVKEQVEIERAKSERDTEIAFLKREMNELMGSLENEKVKLNRVCWERDVVKSDFDGLAEEANGLRLKVVEMEKKDRFTEDEVEKLKIQCQGLVQEKAEKERAAQRKHAESERVTEGLKKEIEGIVREKNEIEKEKHGQEVRLFRLENEVEHLSKVELNLRQEKELLHLKVLELEKSINEAMGKEEERERDIKALVEEKREKEHSIERLNEEVKSHKALLDMVTEELKNKEQRIKEMEQKKNEMEEAKVNQETEIAELNREVAEQRDIVSTLRNSCSGQEDKNERLVSEVSQYKYAVDRVMQERSEAQKSLDGEKMKVEDLMLTISDREKTIKETEKELGKLRSERDNVSEKNEVMESRLESLVKEKDVMQKNLVEALKKIHDWEAKFESEGAKLKRALTMLKNTAALVSSKSEGKEEVVPNDHKLGKEIQPYVVELDAIQNAFRNKEKMVGDLKQQVESLQKVAEAQKKKSFWTLVSSATTIIAAASVAYVAKGR
ncbi:PREDICTED: myosin heavy chain, striated muscle [Prunus mume]|uniref:Myosin heavy chain, striated muscle n=1 Tax=Prunus mume TaxID=102107 RepID=A0ABM0N1Q2_PRUMU|nr:PREDICTED: myosin heavy chain, striated muscle [Prunus mume]